MISTDEFKNGLTIKLDGKLYTIVEFQHVKPGKGSAFVRTKLRNLRAKTVIDKTFDAGTKIEEAFIEDKKLQFMYKSGTRYHFMDGETYEQFEFEEDAIGEGVKFLKENLGVSARFNEGELLEVILPIFVELRVEESEPGVRGDTARNTLKPARVETGATIQVPLFVEPGDIIKVDTRTGEYVGRA